jgi:hypothetical protein
MPAAALLPTNKFSLLMQDMLTIVVNAITGGGGNGFLFTVPPSNDGTPRSVAFNVSGTFTVASVTLKSSQDGGTTLVPYGNSAAQYGPIDVNAQKSFVMTGLIPGICYAMTVGAVTGTSVTISASVS